ncbi:MAG: YicC family protein [Polyangiaceae bacterium]|nr:YicC family protein [Polyangiaceae bacterium]
MTGFGSGEASLPEGRVVAELRTVNSRHLEVRVRLPREMSDMGMGVEQQIRARLGRGRCDAVLRLELSGQVALALDHHRARAALRALEELRDACCPGSDIPLSLLAAIPDVFVPAEQTLVALRQAAALAVEQALNALEEARLREGVALREDLTRRVRLVEEQVERLSRRSPEAHAAIRRRLAERIRALLAAEAAEGLSSSPRLEQEIVAFADRSDVQEELTRLKIHLARMEELFAAQGPVGRELDFLLQEANREANTVGAKAQDAAMAQSVVAIKAELERLREQVQNVE